ncbi:MAG: hypothetical protein ABSB78_04190 [Bacteroidota bacterium]
MDQPFYSNFLANLFATIVGIGIGLPIALWIDRIVRSRNEKEKKKESAERVRKILTVLQAELKENYDSIGQFSDSLDNKLYLVRVESWKAFSDGGELQWLNDPDLLGVLSSTYTTINNYQFILDKYIQVRIFPQAVMDPALRQNMYHKVIDHQDAAQKKITTCLQSINKKLEKTSRSLCSTEQSAAPRLKACRGRQAGCRSLTPVR